MTQLKEFSTQIDAQMAADFLRSRGFETQISGSRDFRFEGTPFGKFVLYVDENYYASALQCLEEVNRRAKIAAVKDEE